MKSNLEDCPYCGANLQGDPIPEEEQHLFGATHFSRMISLYDWELDRTTTFKCPDCGGEWEREQ